MAKYERKPDGVRYHAYYGRIMEKQGYATRIHWSKQMIDYLRQHFPNTLNEELAGCLGVSQRTMIRKARELGLEKDQEWLSAVWDERRIMATAASKRKGIPGGFKKGEHHNPAGEFKPGNKLPAEALSKISEKMKRWYRQHPVEVRAKAMKAWETRRTNQSLNNM